MCASIQGAIAGIYSASLTNLCGTYPYISEKGPQSIDLHTEFTTVSNVSLTLSGYNSSGSWSGGACTGPLGALVGINTITYNYLHGTGSFTTNIILGSLYRSNAKDGRLNISICNGLVACIDGGGFVTTPWFSLSSVVLTVEGQPSFVIREAATDGTIVWSSTPDSVTARVENAISINGNWSTCVVTSISRTGAVVTLPTTETHFLRAVYDDQ